jgi:hypothetical protein
MNTAQSHNAGLTGRIDMPDPGPTYMPTPTSSLGEQKNRTNQTPEETRGSTRQSMRLEVARMAIADLQRENLSWDERMSLMKLIDRLTEGKWKKSGIKPGAKQAKEDIFS